MKDLEQILAAPEAYDPKHDLLDDIDAITEEILEPQGDGNIFDGDAFPHEEYEPEPEIEEEPVVDKIRGKLNQIRVPRDADDFDPAREALETLRQEAGSDAEALALLKGKEAEIQTAQNLAFGKLIENARNAIKQNNFSEAEKELEEARRLDPQSHKLNNLISDIAKGKKAYLNELEGKIKDALSKAESLDEVALWVDDYAAALDSSKDDIIQGWRRQLAFEVQKTKKLKQKFLKRATDVWIFWAKAVSLMLRKHWNWLMS
ncbi:MAG: hypothetical protein IPJ94_23105 [Chloroflexi bacterium]|nr:hypothetical protein [Chloroflexota bacterium]